MDFLRIEEKIKKNDIVISPVFIVNKSKELMVRGKSFYAVWDQEKGLWSTDEFELVQMVDKEIKEYAVNAKEKNEHMFISPMYMDNYRTGSYKQYKQFIKDMPDIYKQLDNKIVFSNTEVKREDYVSRRLNYPLQKGSYKNYEKLISTLYSPEERQKIEWAIGSIISGDSKNIQKFLVFYGDPGTGKSTILDIIQEMFPGYYTIFDAKSLVSNNNTFSIEQFKDNPLIAIQHDGDLSRIEDNSKLNSIVSHEETAVNEKYKSQYFMRFNCFLLMATNKPVKITDAKAGIIRRLIDVRPTGNKIPIDEFNKLRKGIGDELGAIAYHCLEVYNEMGKNYYNKYRPVDMMYKTDPFFNFVEEYVDELTKYDGITLKQAYTLYKQYCEESNATYKLQMHVFREELKNYFEHFDMITRVDGVQLRSYFSGFKYDKLNDKFEPTKTQEKKEESSNWIELKSQNSLFDILAKDYKAQYANDKGTPKEKWSLVNTTLNDISTKELHYVKVPVNHIVIDFDIKDENGNKSLEKNLEAAKKFPKTYVETSQSGQGLHLHYIYDGDPLELSRVYDDNIEVKVFNGNSSLRRRLVKCNDIPIVHISDGLPLKEKKGDKVVNFEQLKSEKVLRSMIKKNLNKEYMGATKPSIDFIKKILDDAYESGMHYDVSDMRQAVLIFATNSSNNADYCISTVNKMKFKSEEQSIPEEEDGPIIFYDVEVFPNLFLVNWKKQGKGNPVVRMINPTPNEIEELCRYKLVGFNCRRYDNHMLYARMMRYNEAQLYKLSQKIINSKKGDANEGFFGEAYNLSYTDIYDYSTNKMSLKKWEIKLGIHHQELGLPWDQPVPEELWPKVAEYCDNDVLATEAVWDATQADFLARQILVSICRHSGIDCSVNDTTNSLTTKIIFGNNRKPELEYTDLSVEFPGYEYVSYGEDKHEHNMYRGEDAGFGGYVYAKPGIFTNVALLDIASMHPHSIIAMNCFGQYTKRFEDLVNARIYIKHKEFDKARKMLDGALAPYLEDEKLAKQLSNALKIPINSVYGLTSAKFPNPFKDPRNVNNIVALRGALFMMTLRDEVIAKGYEVIHIKTDSIKIANADDKIIKFCMDFAKKYKYEFEHEATYEKICLVNGSTYIAKYADGPHEYELPTGEKVNTEWTATAAQFQQPYVFKTLFSHTPIVFKDMCETKEVKGALYLDFNEGLPEGEHDYRFIGKVGEFCPMVKGCGAGELLRFADDKYSAAVGTKGYRWMEAELVEKLNKQKDIDKSYYTKLVDEAVKDISQYDDFEWFVS